MASACQERKLTQLVLKPTLYCYHKCPYCDQRQYYFEDIINQQRLNNNTISIVPEGQRHRGEDIAILARRDEVYRQAKAANPSRWSGETRNWERPETIVLNPDKPVVKLEKAA